MQIEDSISNKGIIVMFRYEVKTERGLGSVNMFFDVLEVGHTVMTEYTYTNHNSFTEDKVLEILSKKEYATFGLDELDV